MTDGDNAVRAGNAPRAAMLCIIGLAALLVLMAVSAAHSGDVSSTLADLWAAIFSYDDAVVAQVVIRDIRIPRVIATALVGAGFAVAGAIMQGTTRNPLADSGVMGVNSGAALGLAICYALLPGMGHIANMIGAFIGAAVAVLVVNGAAMSRRGGMTPIRLVLAGTAVSMLFISLSQGVALAFDVSQDILYWTVGSVAQCSWTQLKVFAPVIVIGLILAMLMSRQISAMSLGEDVARGLGIDTGRVMVLSSVVVLLLAGASVSIVGSVAFIGLVVPHTVRRFVGVDYRLVIPRTAILGAVLVVVADMAARMINPPSIVPLGAVIALIGVPFFLYLARSQRGSA